MQCPTFVTAWRQRSQLPDGFREAGRALEIVVYRITGPQLLGWHVPGRVCPECDLTIAAVEAAVRSAALPGVRVRVKPWLAVLGEALRRGGWHPPVVTVDGVRYIQGRVPDPNELAAHLRALAAGRAACDASLR